MVSVYIVRTTLNKSYKVLLQLWKGSLSHVFTCRWCGNMWCEFGARLKLRDVSPSMVIFSPQTMCSPWQQWSACYCTKMDGWNSDLSFGLQDSCKQRELLSNRIHILVFVGLWNDWESDYVQRGREVRMCCFGLFFPFTVITGVVTVFRKCKKNK